MKNLYQPWQLGDLVLKNRIFMAPLTRCRASEGRVPNALMAEYYAQRASAGLILSEATSVSPMGVGYPDTPGLWSDAQVKGWQMVTEAVHRAQGVIFAQLWHVGRISAPLYLGGEQPVSASAVRPAGHVSLVRPLQDFVTPRPLTLAEIAQVVADYRQAAVNAKAAGFDGVHIHSANGYLLDQFLQDSTNHRTDLYGGSVENRARLLLEVVDACCEAVGASRVAVHLAPRMDAHDMGDSDPKALFGYVARALKTRQIAFISTREYAADDSLTPFLKQEFAGVVVANERFDAKQAEAWVHAGQADAVAFGVPFIANPDLPARLAQKSSLNEPRKALFYGGGAEGYTDYPCLNASAD